MSTTSLLSAFLVQRGRALSLVCLASISLALVMSVQPIAAAETAGPRKVGSTIRIVGEITPSVVDQARALADRYPAIKTVVIRSAGGEPAPVVALAQILRQRRLTLEIDGYCVGMCAQALVVSAHRLKIPPNTLVAFHNETVAVPELMKGQSLYPSGRQLSAADFDVQFYRSLGLPVDLLIDQFTGLGPICLDPAKRRIAFKARLWTPPRSWIERIRPGSDVMWWPRNQDEADKAAARLARDLPSESRVRYGVARPLSDYRDRLTKDQACPI